MLFNRTHGDVLRNLGGDNRSPIERLVKVGYGLSLLATIPLLLIPLQATFGNAISSILRAFFGVKDVSKDLKDGVVTAGVLASACTIAILVPNVEYVFGLSGSTASVLISFVIPAALFLQVSGAQRGQQGHSMDLARGSQNWVNRRRAAAALLAFGLIAGVACTASLVASIQEEAEVVQLAQEIAKVEKKAAEAVATREEAVTVAQAAGAMGEARRRLNATREGVDEALNAVEKASKAADEVGEARSKSKSKHKEVANELQPALKAEEEIVAQLESAATALEAIIASTVGSDSLLSETREEERTVGTTSKDGNGEGRSKKSSAKLAALRKAGLETLQAARDSQTALREAQETLRAKEQSGEAFEVEAIIRKVLTAATAAAMKMDETMDALRAAEAQQKSEMVELVTKLGKQREDAAVTAAQTAAGKCADEKTLCPPSGKAKFAGDEEEDD